MASEARLNHIVKGAPPPDLKPLPSPPLSLTPSPPSHSQKYTPTDPHLASLPSSPPQIYLNLLILESSLRSQYLHLLSRRRLNTFFLLLLGLWNAFFIYALFLRPREDGTGLGGSVYWVVEMLEKLGLMGGVVTVLLVWGTGQWERGIRWPRRWLGTTNRGLRGFNLRVVIVRRKWWREMPGHMAFLLPFGLWREAGGSDWHLVETESGALVEEDLAPGGDHIMLLLLPKSFSPEFRENWEEYRADYWEKENERRSLLRARIRQQQRTRAKEAGGWEWWTGIWRLSPLSTRKHPDAEKQPHGQHHGHPQRHGQMPLLEKDALKAARRRSLMRSESTHSRQSSRSSTPHTMDLDGVSEKPLSERPRRGSSNASIRRKGRDRRDGTGSARNSIALSPLTTSEDEPRKAKGSRPSTPVPDSGSSLGRSTPVPM